MNPNKISIVGGVEGGATHSNILLLNSNGKILATSRGPGTNHHLIGMVECRKRIAEMVNHVKHLANIPSTRPLDALGLCLSGCEQEESNEELANGFEEFYPNLSEMYFISSDTEGSLAATSNSGGIVCISGTGSNTLLINPDGTKVQSGGWGYLLGDEGSAWYISQRAIKYCFNDLDNFERSPYPIERVWQTIQHHFHIETQADILLSFYKNFDKAYIAKLCKKFSELAINDNDELARHVFKEAGRDLAKFIISVYPKAADELRNRDGGAHILCAGGVWLSWPLLKPGFLQCLNEYGEIEQLTLLKLTSSMALGAAYLAADRKNVQLKRIYSKNFQIFYKYNRNESEKN